MIETFGEWNCENKISCYAKWSNKIRVSQVKRCKEKIV